MDQYVPATFEETITKVQLEFGRTKVNYIIVTQVKDSDPAFIQMPYDTLQ
jgi:hypothetical protein